MPTQRQPRPRAIPPAIATAFLLSGMAALLYEVLVLRSFRLITGNATDAVAITLSIYMVGLAIGNAFGARRAESSRRGLAVYAGLEVAAALWFLTLPLLVHIAQPLLTLSYGSAGEHTLLLMGTRLLVCGLILLPPCIALGATLPFVVRALSASPQAAARISGRLYAINALGGAIGALLGTFVLLPRIGATRSACVAAAIGLAAALLAWQRHRRGTAPTTSAPPADPATTLAAPPPLFQPRLLMTLYAIAGAISFGYEVVWTRFLTQLIGGSSYSFAIMLAAFIAGIGLGAALSTRLLLPRRRRATTLGMLYLLVALTSLVSAILIGGLFAFAATLYAQLGDHFATIKAIEAGFVLTLMLIPAALMGAAFPLLTDSVARASHTISRAMGRLLCWNTIGCVVGSLLTAWLLLPLLGLRGSVGALTLASTAMGITYLAYRDVGRIARIIALPLIVLILLLALLASAVLTPDRTAVGPYVSTRNRQLSQLIRQSRILLHKDGACATITVRETTAGERVIFVNGKPDASSRADLPTQLMVGHIPLLMHPDPQRVAVIGLASGITLDAASTHDLVQLDCIEISRDMLAAADLFAIDNHDVLSDPRLEIVLADGRNHLALTDRRYDVIISEPSNPWIAGIASLFTRDYFQACRRALAPGGVACSWLESYTVDDEAFRSVVAAFLEVFPYASLWSVQSSDFLLIGSMQPLQQDAATLASRLQTPLLAHSLSRIEIETAEDLFANYLLDRAGMAQLSADIAPHTDDRAQLEFATPRTVIHNPTRWALQQRINALRCLAPPELSLPTTGQPAPAERLARRLTGRGHLADYHAHMAHQRESEAVAALRAAAQDAPRDRLVEHALTRRSNMAAQAAQAKQYQAAAMHYGIIIDIAPHRSEAQYGLGFCCEKLGKLTPATTFYTAAIQLEPTNPKYIIALAMLLDKTGDAPGARRLALQACDVSKWADPAYVEQLARLLIKQGQPDEARQAYTRGIAAATAANHPQTQSLQQCRDTAFPPAP